MDEQLKKLIDLFWEGKLNIVERKNLLAQLEQLEVDLLESLKTDFKKEEIHNSEKLFSAAEYLSILESIHQEILLPQKERRIFPWKKSLLIAASFLTFLFFANIIYQNSSEGFQNKNTKTPILNEIVLTNNKTVNQRAILPDQSILTLFPKSHIRYHSGFGKTARKIELFGKAKFEVYQDFTKPFIVLSNGITTTALGTVFIIESYSPDLTSIKLLSGKVLINKADNTKPHIYPKTLNAGEEFRIEGNKVFYISKQKHYAQKTLKQKEVASKIFTASDSIVFLNQSLSSVFTELSKLKAIQIHFLSKDVKGKTFTGEFPKDNSIEMILDIICRLNDLNYIKEDNKVQIFLQLTK